MKEFRIEYLSFNDDVMYADIEAEDLDDAKEWIASCGNDIKHVYNIKEL